jgi:hypothetical protein
MQLDDIIALSASGSFLLLRLFECAFLLTLILLPIALIAILLLVNSLVPVLWFPCDKEARNDRIAS